MANLVLPVEISRGGAPVGLVLVSVGEAVQERSQQPPKPAEFSRGALGTGQLCWKKEAQNSRRQEIQARL